MRSPVAELQRTAQRIAERERWPFPWVFPPEDAIEFSVRAAITAPAVGVQTQILSYVVPAGFQAVIKGIFHTYQGTGFVEGSGGIVWVIDVNRPIGLTALTGRPLGDFGSILTTLGSLTQPWPLAGGIGLRVYPGDTVRYKVTIVSGAIATGPPNNVLAILAGWRWPLSRSF